MGEAPPLAIRIIRAEVKIELKALKIGKAADFDNIPAEPWKDRNLLSEDVTCTQLNNIWNDKVIPTNWKMVRPLAKLQKKGDLSEYANSRGIMLLPTVIAKVSEGSP